ncbi:MAG: ATP-binding protein [Chloroflexi bacterium OHK40]
MRLLLTARMRLALLLSALFIGAGGILLGLNYTLVRYRLQVVPVPFAGTTGTDDTLVVLELPLTQSPQQPVQITVPSPDELATLRALEQQIIEASLRELLLQSSIALALMAVIVSWLSWIVAGRVLRPVRAITAVARRLSEERLHERIALAGPHDELKELADTFDGMLSRLEQAFGSQRRFAASASHELRTPLTIMRTEVEVTLADPQASVDELRAMGETVRDAVLRCERLIDGLLTLARSEQAVTRRDVVDLAVCAQIALAQLGGEARLLEVRPTVRLAAASVMGDPALLERLISNLVANAVRHNQRGGWLSINSCVEGEQAILRVENSGPAVPPEQVEELFLPFRRLAGERLGSAQGTGLGLTIARAIAEAHGGHLLARARSEGGLQVELRLPRVPGVMASTA